MELVWLVRPWLDQLFAKLSRPLFLQPVCSFLSLLSNCFIAGNSSRQSAESNKTSWWFGKGNEQVHNICNEPASYPSPLPSHSPPPAFFLACLSLVWLLSVHWTNSHKPMSSCEWMLRNGMRLRIGKCASSCATLPITTWTTTKR